MAALVIADHDNSEIKGATLNAITAAGQLGDVDVLVAGENCQAAADAAAAIQGVAKVRMADNAAYGNALAEPMSTLIVALAGDYNHIVAPHTTSGKNIAPQYIENKLKFSPYINDAVVVGDRRKYLTALVVLDEDNVAKYAQDHKVAFSTYAELADNPAIIQLIEQEVNTVNKQLARVENIRKFRILPKRLYEEDGEVTPTMKVKRTAINKQYADLIESMYAG